jgi:prepilin-type N-terminal cleavage/methylation domain-containing protein
VLDFAIEHFLFFYSVGGVPMRSAQRRAFTLVELLVVIAIIDILVAVLIPAINAAREAARRTQCLDNLKNIGLAANNHLNAHKFFPSGGWGWLWAGDPDRGFNERQPGGWLYNILPFMEDHALHDKGKGMPAAQKRAAATEVIKTPLAWATCPTRRDLRPFRNIFNPTCNNCQDPIPEVARSDYSANCHGPNWQRNEFQGGPATLAQGDDPAYTGWRNTTCNNAGNDRMCGISFERSTVRIKHIKDGVSHTYFVGERYLNRLQYGTGEDQADNEHMYVGFDNDMYKTGHVQPMGDGEYMPNGVPQPDPDRWGSAHPQVFHVVLCDASTHRIPFEIDLRTHQSLSHRADGKVLDDF